MTSDRLGKSRSAPSLLAAATNLRGFSLQRGKIPAPEERPSSATVWAKKREEFGQIDLIGGNGRWRQRLAEEVFERVREEDVKERARLADLEAKRARRAAQREEVRRKYQEEEDAKWRSEQERKRKEKEEIEEERRELERKEHERKEQIRKEIEKRQPKPCETCDSTGVCHVCNGVGGIFSTFLVKEVNGQCSQDYGRRMEGCTACGGCKQGIRGELQKGSGKCAKCGGLGKIWPDIAHERHALHRGRTHGHLTHTSSHSLSPHSPTAS